MVGGERDGRDLVDHFTPETVLRSCTSDTKDLIAESYSMQRKEEEEELKPRSERSKDTKREGQFQVEKGLFETLEVLGE